MVPLASRFALALAFGLAGVGAACAHPHVWVKSRGEIVFDAAGRIVAVRQNWTFDDVYSAFATQAVGQPGQPIGAAALAPVAEQNMADLKQYKFFTVAKAAGKVLAFEDPVDASADAAANGVLTLRFTLPLSAPASAGKAFTYQVYDPSFFVDFSFEDAQPITLTRAPAGCSASVLRPRPLEPAETAKLNESFFSGLSPGADFGVRMAGRAIVACP